MRRLFIGFLALYLFSFANLSAQENKAFSKVEIEPVYKDTVGIRALFVSEDDIFFGGSKGKFGHFKIDRNTTLNDGRKIPVVYKIIANEVIEHEGTKPEFRAVGETKDAFYLLSAGTPALLYRYDKKKPKLELVYKEEGEKVFYDSMAFWNDKEGIAMGDPTNGCLSIIITRNGGKTWEKVSCKDLPATAEGEAAFAASNSNIAIEGNDVWIVSGGKKSRVFHSADKGKSWKVFETPIIQGTETTGAYSVDFFNSKKGFMIGGDYTNPTGNSENKAVTNDGGKTWKLVANGSGPGYKSNVAYVPNSNAEALVAVGPSGISYSADGGSSWKDLSTEAYYTIEFVDENTAYAAGNGKISKLEFK